MPGNVDNAVPSGVLPQSLCTVFTEVREFGVQTSAYHDATMQRGQLTTTSRKRWRMSKKLAGAVAAALLGFWESHRSVAFYYYNPMEPGPGNQIGSNYDGTGTGIQGRYTVVFRGGWSQVTGMARVEVGGLELVE